MKDQLLLNRETKTEVDRFITSPNHALIIEGKSGAGKYSLANHIAARLVNVDYSKIADYPQLLRIVPKVSSVTIDQIREAQNFLKLKTTGGQPVRRILIVEQAELMTIEAQNAFLKILEEPPADTVILILTSQKVKLLPTIRSRAQLLSIKRLDQATITSHFKKLNYKDSDLSSAYHVADGQIGLMTSLLSNDQSSQELDNLKLAKAVLAKSRFERLAYVDEIIKQKDNLPGLIQALITVSQAAMKATAGKDNISQSRRWHSTLNYALEAEKQSVTNANNKLLLTNLLINL